MNFIVYRPLSGAWATVMILRRSDEIPDTVGEGIIKVVTGPNYTTEFEAEIFARGLAEGLGMIAHGSKVQWHWSDQ